MISLLSGKKIQHLKKLADYAKSASRNSSFTSMGVRIPGLWCGHTHCNIRHTPPLDAEQFFLVLPADRHLFSQLFHRDGFPQGPGEDRMDDFRREQSQPDHSGDKRGVFPDGLCQFNCVAVSPGIDQRLPAEHRTIRLYSPGDSSFQNSRSGCSRCGCIFLPQTVIVSLRQIYHAFFLVSASVPSHLIY